MTDAQPSDDEPAIVIHGPAGVVVGHHNVQNNYFSVLSPDPVEAAAETLGKVVLAQWRQEARLRGLHGSERIPVRWRARYPGEAGDRSPPPGAPVDGDATDLASFVETFRRLPQRRLVVLGGAGSGKTSLAVLLVIELLLRMEDRDPVPVLLPLASWRPRAEHLYTWLERQLLHEYPQLDPETVGALRRDQRVLPVLDGLDELPVAERPEALAALDSALQDGDPLVLTCRTGDFAAAARGKAVLGEAAVVEAEPLTAEEVSRYLLRTATREHEDRWRPLTDTLTGDPPCPAAEVLTVPLMLWLRRTAYRRPASGRDPGELADRERFPTAGTVESHLLDSLVPSVYPTGPPPPPLLGRKAARRWPGENRRRDPERVSRWLRFLARHLEQRRTPDLAWWELGTTMRLVPRMLLTGLVTGVCVAVLIGPFDGITAALVEIGSAQGLGPSLVDGFVTMVVDALVNALPSAVVFALVHGIGYVFRGGALEPSRIRFRLGGAGRLAARSGPEILARAGIGLAAGLAVGPGIALLTALASALLSGHPAWLRVGLVNAPLYGFLFGLAGALAGGLMAWCEAPVAIESAPDPRDLLALNRRTLLLQWLMLAPPLGVVVGLGGRLTVEFLDSSLWGIGLVWNVADGLRFGVLTALGGGLGIALSLTAWGQWTVLARIWLPLTGHLPPAAMTFLEDAHQRGVLRKAGAVYQFRHARLQHHFARPADRPAPPVGRPSVP
ncbi:MULTISPECIES: NACHT domain-containing protein [Streptomycetaceae]|uniref:NACHT domain-containing protein n=1 Tax=Streptomycetaceae TaxID=2062 RepID=UPI00093EF10F|nr:NACHT domain-containing protein [Streptomyces sp. CB02056]